MEFLVPSSTLLNLCDVQLEQAVQPRQEFLSIQSFQLAMCSTVFDQALSLGVWFAKGQTYLDSPMVG